MNNLQPIKKTGKPQRSDIDLTPGIAVALAGVILEGRTLYPKSGSLTVSVLNQDGTETEQTLNIKTIQSWVVRGNVIPGMNVPFRDFIDGKRAEKRSRDRQAAHQAIIDAQEVQLKAISRFSLKPRPDIERRYKVLPNGERFLTSETEIEFGTSPKMIEAITRALTFGLERLDPERYSSKSETKNTHLVFSLADIQRIRENRNTEDGRDQ